MRFGLVGQQCVECGRGRAEHPPGRGPPSAASRSAGAVVTWTLVAINVAMFLVTWVRPGIVTDLEMLGYARYITGRPARTAWRLTSGTG